METIRLSTDPEDIRRGGEIIRKGGLVAFPTETVYGLGADALNAEAVRSVYAAKGRPSDNPMIVHIADATALEPLVKGGRTSITEDALKLIGTFWPGPLTLVFPKSDIVPDATTGGMDTVAIRMPSNGTAQRLILAAQRPIAAPSANLSGRPSPTTAEDVLEDMDGRIDAVIMGEQCDVGIESTVIDVTGPIPTILRPGIITREWISAVLGRKVMFDPALMVRPSGESDPDFHPKSPGMKYKHYSPKAKVTLIDCAVEEFQGKATALGLEAVRNGLKPAMIDYGDDVVKAAHNLFADMRELDRQGYDIIFIRALEQSGLGFSVMNRMLKSAGYDIVE